MMNSIDLQGLCVTEMGPSPETAHSMSLQSSQSIDAIQSDPRRSKTANGRSSPRVLWKPTAESIEKSEITAFRKLVNERHSLFLGTQAYKFIFYL